MKCPFCQETETKVIDKREATEEAIRRRRECLECSKRFTTYEKLESPDIKIIKKDGKKEDFDISKVRSGILKAVEKLPVTEEQIDSAVNSIESKIRNEKTTEVPAKKVGEYVMKELKKLDKVAYIRFASVYKEFADLDDFKEEMKNLVKR